MLSDKRFTKEEFSWLIKERNSQPCGLSLSASADQENEIPVVACMSFSVPETTWIELSRELEQVGGAFVIQGLPNNSFSELAKQLRALIEKVVNAPVILDPKFFTQHNVDRAPTFIVSGRSGVDKVVGNTSLSWVLERVECDGDSGYKRGGEDA